MLEFFLQINIIHLFFDILLDYYLNQILLLSDHIGKLISI